MLHTAVCALLHRSQCLRNHRYDCAQNRLALLGFCMHRCILLVNLNHSFFCAVELDDAFNLFHILLFLFEQHGAVYLVASYIVMNLHGMQ